MDTVVLNETKTIKAETTKDRLCPHCGTLLKNASLCEYASHVKFCPKKKRKTSIFPDMTVCNEVKAHTSSPLKAIRFKCLDCCVGSAHEVELCTTPDCPLWTRRFGIAPKTARARGKNVVKNLSVTIGE